VTVVETIASTCPCSSPPLVWRSTFPKTNIPIESDPSATANRGLSTPNERLHRKNLSLASIRSHFWWQRNARALRHTLLAWISNWVRWRPALLFKDVLVGLPKAPNDRGSIHRVAASHWAIEIQHSHLSSPDGIDIVSRSLASTCPDCRSGASLYVLGLQAIILLLPYLFVS